MICKIATARHSPTAAAAAARQRQQTFTRNILIPPTVTSWIANEFVPVEYPSVGGFDNLAPSRPSNEPLCRVQVSVVRRRGHRKFFFYNILHSADDITLNLFSYNAIMHSPFVASIENSDTSGNHQFQACHRGLVSILLLGSRGYFARHGIHAPTECI